MRRLLTPGWLACHLLLLVAVAAMLALAGWQFARASGGNQLSWGYTLQWPVFAGFAVFIWAREVRRVLRGEPVEDPRAPRSAGEPHFGAAAGVPTTADAAAAGAVAPRAAAPTTAAAADDPATRTAAGARAGRAPVITRRPSTAAYDDQDDPQLAAYNRYLSWLAANPGARPVDYPG